MLVQNNNRWRTRWKPAKISVNDSIYSQTLYYNDDYGYNKFTVIMNKIMSHFWSQMTGYKDVFHGYNESRL